MGDCWTHQPMKSIKGNEPRAEDEKTTGGFEHTLGLSHLSEATTSASAQHSQQSPNPPLPLPEGVTSSLTSHLLT